MAEVCELSFSQALALPCLRGRVVHLIDADLSCSMGIPESECVQSGAKDDDLPNASFDSFGQGIFRNPASGSSE